MNDELKLRAIPVNDRTTLLAALRAALDGGPALLPVAAGQDPAAALEGLNDLPADTALVIRTSGSSGVPKAVALSASALTASAEATHERFGGPGQWLITLPTQLISGVQMLVRSLVAGTEPVYLVDFAPEADPAAAADAAPRGFDPATFFAAAAALTHERRYVSLVPVQLARLIDFAESAPSEAEREALLAVLRRFNAILVGGQATPLDLRSRAYKLEITLRRSYGMTETAGGCVYDGVEIGETRVRIRAGEVQLAGPTLALGYANDPDLTAERFFEDAGVRWYRTGDSGELLGGMLTVTGRLDRVIVSGGVNVSLDAIERIVGEQPGWAGALAVGVADEEWGERPVIVRAEGASVDGFEEPVPFVEVREAVRAALGAGASPDREVVFDELPRLAGGKPDREAIRARVAVSERPQS